MATVWLAWDRTRKADIALKILHPQLAASSSERRRLQREIRATSALRHPAVLAPYDLHDFGDFLALSMPLHKGCSLLDHVADGSPYDSEALRALGIRIAEALGAAHDLGVLHRDVTPANIMVTEGRDAVLMDFGLARLADNTATATRAMATPGYTAPELYAGDRGDPRSDLYGLGASLYYAATGRSPFAGREAAALMGHQLSGGHTPLTAVRSELPADLSATIEALLSPLPQDRPSSAASVARALMNREAPTASHLVSLEPGATTLWVEKGDESSVSLVLRRRGVVPGRVESSAVAPDRPWPAIRNISVGEAASIGEALAAEGVDWSAASPSSGLAQRLFSAAHLATAVSAISVLLSAVVANAVFLSGYVRPSPHGPFGSHPVILITLIVAFVCFSLTFSIRLCRNRPRPTLGRRLGFAASERRIWAGLLLVVLISTGSLLPLLFLAPIASWQNWFLMSEPTAGALAFANFALVGSWGFALGLVGLSGALFVTAMIAEYRNWARASQKPWYLVRRTARDDEARLPQTVGIARERLASARRWLLVNSKSLPASAARQLKDCVRRLQLQVDWLAERSRQLEDHLVDSSDRDFAADVGRIERRLERLGTLGDGDGAIAHDLKQTLAEHRQAIARSEAIENRRMQIRASLVRIATAASNAVVTLIGEEQGTEELIEELANTVADTRAAIDEVEESMEAGKEKLIAFNKPLDLSV
jgi:serine/threonine protein kinase